MSKQFFDDPEVEQRDTTVEYTALDEGTTALFEVMTAEAREASTGTDYVRFGAKVIAHEDENIVGRWVYDNFFLSENSMQYTRDKFIDMMDDRDAHKQFSGTAADVAEQMAEVMVGATFVGVLSVREQSGYKPENQFKYINPRRRWKGQAGGKGKVKTSSKI